MMLDKAVVQWGQAPALHGQVILPRAIGKITSLLPQQDHARESIKEDN